jgi:hypothetical protein
VWDSDDRVYVFTVVSVRDVVANSVEDDAANSVEDDADDEG